MMPTSAQSQIPPPIQLLINLPVWFIIKRLLLRRDQSGTGQTRPRAKAVVAFGLAAPGLQQPFVAWPLAARQSFLPFFVEPTWTSVHSPNNLGDCNVDAVQPHNHE